MENTLRPCRAVSPVAAYIGGKRGLAKIICQAIAAIPHTTYAEPFVGMGGVFLRRELRPDAEIINDRSDEVATLFRVLQHHYQAFMDMLKWQLTTRADFDILMKTDPSTLTDLRKAARFLYLQRTGFGGKVTGRNFGVDMSRPARFDITRLQTMLEDVHERLAGVVIENLDYKDFIERYDAEGTLFYLDPPYFGSEDYYGKEFFNRAEFKIMADRLKTLRGRFLLSLNSHPDVHEIFKDFQIEMLKTTWSVSSHEKKEIQEVLISNAPIQFGQDGFLFT